MPLECATCKARFDSNQKLCLHMFKKHKVKNPVRRCLGHSTSCFVCLKQFWSRERVLNHLRYRSKSCFARTLELGFQISEDEANQLDECDKVVNLRLHNSGRRRHHVDWPCVRLHGPLRPLHENM